MTNPAAEASLNYFGQNPGTMFGNQPEPSLPMAFPFGDGLSGLGMSMGAQFIASQMGIPEAAQYQMFPTMNPADFASKQKWFAEKQRAIQQASQADARTQMEMAERMARMTGINFGPEARAMAQSAVDLAQTFTPIAAQMAPDAYDSLMTMMGGRGSAAVMSAGMFRGGRYAVDPITGKMGLSGDSAGLLANTIKNDFFGPQSDINTFRGLSAGKAGLLYEEMSTRGLLGRGIGTYETDTQQRLLLDTPDGMEAGLKTLKSRDPEKFEKIVAAAEEKSGRKVRGRGMTSEQELKAIGELDGVAGELATELVKFTGAPEMEQALRDFDARKIKDKLKDMSGAVAAMRDIFGDAGRTNAPMSELMSGLAKMTQNGLTSMSGSEMENSVRMTYQLAKQSGMGLDAMLGVQGQLGQMADQYGIDRGFAIQAGQNMAAFAGAYRAVGAGATPEFGKSGLDKMAVLDAELNMRASASPLANALSAALRLQDEGRIGQDSDMARLAQAAKEGKTTYRGKDGQEHSVNVDSAQWLQLAQDAGVSQNDANTMLQQTKANEEYGVKNNVQTSVRNVMGQEISNTYLRPAFEAASSGFAEALGGRLNQSPEQTAAMRKAIADAVTDTMDDSGMIEPEERKKKMGDAVRTAVRTHLKAQGMSDADIEAAVQKLPDKEVENVVSMMSGEANQVFGANAQQLGYSSFADFLVANSPDVRDQREKQKQEAGRQVELRKALGGVGRQSFMANLNKAMEGGKTLQEALGTVLGQVDKEELERALVPVQNAQDHLKANPNTANADQYKDALERGGEAATAALEAYAKDRGVAVADLNYTDDPIAAGLKAAKEHGGAHQRTSHDRIKAWAAATQEFNAQLKDLEGQKPSAENDAKRKQLIELQAAIADGGKTAKEMFERQLAGNSSLTEADKVKLRTGLIDESSLPESEKIKLRALYSAQQEEHSIDETLTRAGIVPTPDATVPAPDDPSGMGGAAGAGAAGVKKPKKPAAKTPASAVAASIAAAVADLNSSTSPEERKRWAQEAENAGFDVAGLRERVDGLANTGGAGGAGQEQPLRITGTVTLNGDGTAELNLTNSQYGSTPTGTNTK